MARRAVGGPSWFSQPRYELKTVFIERACSLQFVALPFIERIHELAPALPHVAFAIIETISARLAYFGQGAVQPLQLGQGRLLFLSNGVANGDRGCAQHHQENKGQGPHERLPESIASQA
ncbi:MAG: hypothetical protein WBW73_00815 [Rhodoplanes sp.]